MAFNFGCNFECYWCLCSQYLYFCASVLFLPWSDPAQNQLLLILKLTILKVRKAKLKYWKCELFYCTFLAQSRLLLLLNFLNVILDSMGNTKHVKTIMQHISKIVHGTGWRRETKNERNGEYFIAIFFGRKAIAQRTLSINKISCCIQRLVWWLLLFLHFQLRSRCCATSCHHFHTGALW